MGSPGAPRGVEGLIRKGGYVPVGGVRHPRGGLGQGKRVRWPPCAAAARPHCPLWGKRGWPHGSETRRAAVRLAVGAVGGGCSGPAGVVRAAPQGGWAGRVSGGPVGARPGAGGAGSLVAEERADLPQQVLGHEVQPGPQQEQRPDPLALLGEQPLVPLGPPLLQPQEGADVLGLLLRVVLREEAPQVPKGESLLCRGPVPPLGRWTGGRRER
mmetsp:Transcript_123374/g.213909  ORF Transcript_123374/g.213909 Transcript_123374/m.213909 type:complete len:213 (+) Transcript_123374:134-772(+)